VRASCSGAPGCTGDDRRTWESLLDPAELAAILWRGPRFLEETCGIGGSPPRRRDGDGERRNRADAADRVLAALGAALGDDRLIAYWLRRPNVVTDGEAPLSWMSGPTRMIVQIAMRLERENRARRGGAR